MKTFEVDSREKQETNCLVYTHAWAPHHTVCIRTSGGGTGAIALIKIGQVILITAVLM